jgi:hypothetical protein
VSLYAPAEWRFSVVAPFGVEGVWKKVTILTHLAQDVELLYQLNRSTMLTFSVPSENPQVNIPHTDGLPYIAVGPRWVLGWRKAPATLNPTPGQWVLKYAGRIWSIQDTGDGDNCRTVVTCFDCLKHLEKRIVRDAMGGFKKQVAWWAVPGTQVIQEMIDRTQTKVGTVRIDLGGMWEESALSSVKFDQAMIMPSILRLTDTGTVDLDTQYLDGSDGNFMLLGGRPRLGQDRPNVVLGYAAPPRRAIGYDRTQSLDNLANDVTLFGKSSKGHTVHAADAVSQATYDIFEEVAVIPDVETTELLQMLADEEIFLRKNPNDLISIIPTPEDSPRFFNEYFLGDTIKLRAAVNPFPVTREAIIGIQRVYGVRLKVDNEYGEAVVEMIASANAESSQ